LWLRREDFVFFVSLPALGAGRLAPAGSRPERGTSVVRSFFRRAASIVFNVKEDQKALRNCPQADKIENAG
jgi:hypothetical protein